MKAVTLRGYREPNTERTLVPVQIPNDGQNGGLVSLWNGRVHRWHRRKA